MVDPDDFNVHPKPICSLFRYNVMYEIPIYQRKYEWSSVGEDSPVQILWKDITDIIRDTNKESHYIGSLVTMFITPSKFSLIDGQQRLTTLSLLIRALTEFVQDEKVLVSKALFEQLSDDEVENDVYKLNLYECLRGLILFKGEPRLYRASGTTGNYDDVIKSTGHYEGKKTREELCYQYFYEQLKEIQAGQSDGLSIDNIIDTLLTRIKIVKISMENEENAAFVFNSLNANGLRLSPISMIKNYVMLCDNKEQKSIYEKIWKPFEDIFNGNDSKLADYLRVYLMMKNGEVVLKNDLYKKTKSEIYELIKGKKKIYPYVEEYFKPIITYSQNYKYVSGLEEYPNTNNLDGARIRNSLNVITACGFKSHRCFALMLFNHYGSELQNGNKKAMKELRQCMDILESFIVRRTLQQNMLNNTIDRKFIELCRDKVYARSDILKALKDIPPDNAGYWPDDEMLSDSLRKKDFYGDGRAGLCIAVFKRIEIMIRDDPETVFPTNAGVEHIFPQTPKTKWKKQYDDKEEYTQLEQLKNRLGNLTLLNLVENSSASNNPYRKKYDETYKDSSYRITQTLPDIDHWTLDNFTDHQEKMIKFILSTWKTDFRASPKKKE